MCGDGLVAIDCFAGAGGLSVGLQRAGFEVRSAFDHDADSVKTYNANLGQHAVEADAENLTGAQLLEAAGCAAGGCTLVAGGPPCQGFSVQRRGSSEDVRNDLIFHFLRLVEDVGPEFFLMENVPAIRGPRGRAYLEVFVARARQAGYLIHAAILDAAAYGVPQHRRRAFIVGERADRPPAFVFPTPTHDKQTWATVRTAIADLPSPESEPDLARAVPNHVPSNISEVNKHRLSFVPQGGGRDDVPAHLRVACHSVSVDKIGHRNVYGRMHWDRPAPTITTKCNSFTRGQFGHPSENRNVTMREAARLQGFPDSFVFLGGIVSVAHQVGNAVPPPLAETLGRAIIRAHELRKATPAQLTLSLGAK